MSKIIYKEESYKIIGICMEIHRVLGMGFKEWVYKEAMELEFKQNGITYSKEKLFRINYKGITLSKKQYADFVTYNSIMLEVKASPFITEAFRAQTINYLKASELKLGMILNFGERSFKY